MTRCKKCNQKSSVLLGCKCNNHFCTKHLLPELHNCTEMDNFRKDAHDKNEKKVLEQSVKKEKLEWSI